jgi:periplasmic protein TonB
LSVVRPAGLGLDEGALASVVQYVFQPAMQDGKPVLVELNIEVNFQVF